MPRSSTYNLNRKSKNSILPYLNRGSRVETLKQQSPKYTHGCHSREQAKIVESGRTLKKQTPQNFISHRLHDLHERINQEQDEIVDNTTSITGAELSAVAEKSIRPTPENNFANRLHQTKQKDAEVEDESAPVDVTDDMEEMEIIQADDDGYILNDKNKYFIEVRY